MFELDAFLIGAIIGTTSSICGALIDYFRLRDSKGEEASGVPGCIFLVSGGLGLLGIIVIVISFIAQNLGRSLWAGLGVLVGFTISFIVLVILWFFVQKNKS